MNSLGVVCGPEETLSGLGFVEPGYVAEDQAQARVDIPSCDTDVALGSLDQAKAHATVVAHPCSIVVQHETYLLPPGTRVPKRPKQGFPSLKSGRAARILPIGVSSEAMAGQGHRHQPPPAQPPTRLTGQGNRPSQQSGRTAPSAASAGAQALAEANRQQPRGLWGDDGVNAYGDGQHRGSSSSSGGRGYAWQNNGGGGNGFNAPRGKFVPGISGPPNPKRGRFRQNWGGRGGGRKLKPPLPPQDVPVEKDEPNKAPTKEADKDSSLIQAHGNVADPIPVDKNTAIGKG